MAQADPEPAVAEQEAVAAVAEQEAVVVDREVAVGLEAVAQAVRKSV